MDPLTLMINECNVMLLAMRRNNRAMGGVAAILGSSDVFGGSELFADFGASLPMFLPGLASKNALHANDANDTGKLLEQSFLQLRAILSKSKALHEVDLLTLMQPFMLTIESSSTSSSVTALALNTVSKALQYEILSRNAPNFATTLVQLTTSLTHCRFEASDQNTDDLLLLKVLSLLETIVVSPVSELLPNAVMSEVIHTCLCLACNKRRSEVLRRASEMAMIAITVRVFQRVRELEPENSNGEDLPSNFAELNSEVIGGDDDHHLEESGQTIVEEHKNYKTAARRASATTIDMAPKSPRKPSLSENSKPVVNEQFDIHCINEFLGFLISMISPSNQFQHMESTRVFALSLINTALEVTGDVIPEHPSLMALVADPVSKDVLQIISSTDLPALLQAALRLFCTMSIILKPYLKLQNELTFNLLFTSILPDNAATGQRAATSASLKVALSKETIIEHFSYLWFISPSFFTELFVDFDCDFERSDLASKFIDFLCTLALPESASLTTDNVPPICLDGIRSFVAGVHERTKSVADEFSQDKGHEQIIANKLRKKAFIKCTELFNKKAARGVEALYKESFLKDPTDKKELAQFFFEKSTRLNKKVLGVYLSEPANKDLLKEFMHLFDFSGLRVDEGLRIMLKAFRLPGESQQIERVVETFADAFVASQNSLDGGVLHLQDGQEPVVLDSGAVFLLSFSIIMLNTDLHNPQIKRHMDLNDYERNVSGVHSFPRWYLETMYNSIRDREIVMPEEHHGTEKWFDDVWHNLISSQSKYARDHSASNIVLSRHVTSLFDRLLFESVADKILEMLLEVFKGAEDEVIITQVMSSIDKCAQICAQYSMTKQLDRLIASLAELTGLLKSTKSASSEQDFSLVQMPTTQIKVAGESAPITVSKMSIQFAANYKAQLSFHVLFTLTKYPGTTVSSAWDPIVKIILTLYENCLVEPNLFGEFQKLLKLPPLRKVKPQYEPASPRVSEDSGFMSTVSSFLRSYSDVPEPSKEEIADSKHTMQIVKLVKVASVFESVSKRESTEMENFVNTLLANLPEYNEGSSRYYESEVLFLFEVAVCFALISNGQEVINNVIESLLQHSKTSALTMTGKIRLMTYYLLLVRQSDKLQKEQVEDCIKELLKIDPKVLRQQGSPLVLPLISLADNESSLRNLVVSPMFWELLKELGAESHNAEEVLTFVSSIIEKSPTDINSDNFVVLLGLLDEFSSLGAIYAHYEQKKLTDVSEEDKERMRNLVSVSKLSLTLTQKLGASYHEQFDTLIQAFAHQCFNPCREVRNYAMQLFRTTLLSHGANNHDSSLVVFDFGLFPLLAELEKELVLDTDKEGFSETQLQVLSLLSKSFLMFYDKLERTTSEKIWSGMVRSFRVFDQINSQNPRYKIFREQSSEDMKNMILVLQNDFLQRSNTELWNSTWKELDELFPGLREEVTLNIVDTKETGNTSVAVSEPIPEPLATAPSSAVETAVPEAIADLKLETSAAPVLEPRGDSLQEMASPEIDEAVSAVGATEGVQTV